MAENIQTDSDAEGQFQPGVGKSDQVNRAIHQINPNWVEDGHGIVGPQRQIVPKENARPSPIEFGIDNSRNSVGSETGPCDPIAPPGSGTYVWGSVDGVCQWISTTECP